MTVMTSSSDSSAPERSPDRRPTVRVVLASDLSLIAEAVGAALASRGIHVSLLAWPRVPLDDPVRRQLSRLAPDVALLIYDVDLAARMARAAALIEDWDGPWVVLTGSNPGAAWGGLREAGAASVRPNNTGLDEIEHLIRLLATGAEAPGTDELELYRQAWRQTQERVSEVQRRLNSLSPREHEVLELLRRGVAVREIATRLGVSESTVRSQVRAILRKLDVRSQLAAVALVWAVDPQE